MRMAIIARRLHLPGGWAPTVALGIVAGLIVFT